MKEILNKSSIKSKRREEGEIVYWFVNPKKKIKFLEKKQVLETCPYFIEHKISELNKRK